MRLPFFKSLSKRLVQGDGSRDAQPPEQAAPSPYASQPQPSHAQPSYAHETYIPESYTQAPVPPAPTSLMGDIDVRALGRALVRRRKWILIPTLAAFVLSLAIVNIIHARYRSEARILVESRDNVFMRANAAPPDDQRSSPDPEAITSQVQLVLSRDLARDIIKKNGLGEVPEFDPLLDGMNPATTILALLGVVKDPTSMTKEERVLDAYYDRLQAYAVDKSRVISVEFQSRDPELAARVANSIAEGYLTLQQAAKQDQARSAGQWLSGEIETLRTKVAEAESKVEDFRSRSSLFSGTNNISLSNQQMGEISTQLNTAIQLKSDAESKSQLIRQMLQSGKPIEASDIINSELMRRLNEQRVTLRAQLAEQSSTLLANHPRIKELKAQIADLDNQIRDEASKIARSLENDARIAGARVDSQRTSLDQMKKQATSSNSQDVQLRALEREAKSQRDLLESYLTKYREASTRENIDAAPPDARIISRGTVSNVPAYPKKLPIVLIATLAALLLSSGVILTGELLRMTAAAFTLVAPLQTQGEAPRAAPAFEQRVGFGTRSPAPEQAPAARDVPPMNIAAASAPQQASYDPTLAERINAVRRRLDPLVSALRAAEPAYAPNTAPPSMPPNPASAPQPAMHAPNMNFGNHPGTYPPMNPPMNPPTYAPSVNGSYDANYLAQFAAELRAAGPAARKITVVGTSTMSGTAQTALRLARLLARDARVVLVDLSMPDPAAQAQFEAAAGVSDLVRGLSSFGDAITRDRISSLQIVAAGRSASERAMLNSPRLAMAIDALLQVYDHVVLDGGVITDTVEPLLSQHSHAVLIADAELDLATRQAIADQLTMAGFRAATVLNPAMTGPRDGQGRVAA